MIEWLFCISLVLFFVQVEGVSPSPTCILCDGNFSALS